MSKHVPKELAEDLASMIAEGDNAQAEIREYEESIARKRESLRFYKQLLEESGQRNIKLQEAINNETQTALDIGQRIDMLLDEKNRKLTTTQFPFLGEPKQTRIYPDVGFSITIPEPLRQMKLPNAYLNEGKERFNLAIKAKRRQIQSMQVRLKIKEVVFKDSCGLYE